MSKAQSLAPDMKLMKLCRNTVRGIRRLCPASPRENCRASGTRPLFDLSDAPISKARLIFRHEPAVMPVLFQ
jgi:hypothetical protein